MSSIKSRNVILLLVSFLLASCAMLPGVEPGTTPGVAGAVRAELEPRSGSQALGSVTLTPAQGKVRLDVRVVGLAPGVHGFHVHESGDCSAFDAMSARGHFNPGGKTHGEHAGDLPNLVADASGKVAISVELAPRFRLADGADGIIGRSVVIHADADDFVSQPDGNSGRRVACGTIRRR